MDEMPVGTALDYDVVDTRSIQRAIDLFEGMFLGGKEHFRNPSALEKLLAPCPLVPQRPQAMIDNKFGEVGAA